MHFRIISTRQFLLCSVLPSHFKPCLLELPSETLPYTIGLLNLESLASNMFSKVAILGLASAAIAFAAPGSWSPPESTCTAVTSWSTYELETKVPYYETETNWIPSFYTVEEVLTETSSYPATKTIVTWTPTCIVTAYPTTIWVTKEITTGVPVTQYETCTEVTVIEVPTCTTVWTSVEQISVCTEYSSTCITTSSAIVSTTCAPCSSSQPAVTGYHGRKA